MSLGITAFCEECKKAFEKKRLKQKYCSRTCKTINYNRRVEEAINRLFMVSQGKTPESDASNPCPFCLRPLPGSVNPIPTASPVTPSKQ